MRGIRYVLIALAFISLSLSALCAGTTKKPENASEKTFQELQDKLKKEKHKQKVLSRFEKLDGLTGLTIEDISLVLVNHSYHYLNDSGRRQPFITVRCLIDISKFEKEADQLRAYLKSTGKQGPINIQLPETEKIIVGVLDDVKDEFMTFTSLPRSVKPVIKFAEMQKNKPEYVILTLEQNESCTDCMHHDALNTVVLGFDEKAKTYYKALEVNTYRRVYDKPGPDDDGYVEKATVSWSDWINNKYRELIISTNREILGTKKDIKTAFKKKEEFYSWKNDKELVLVERKLDGKSTMNLRKGQLPVDIEVTLKNGELYERSGKKSAKKITSTSGKIKKYLVSPDKRYVAYSIIADYTPEYYDDGDNKMPPEPIYHIIVMDIKLKKQLTEISPPSKHDPFIYCKRWISNEELLFYETGFLDVGLSYIYHAGTNELRRTNYEERDLQ